MYRLTPSRRDLLKLGCFGAASLALGCGDNEGEADTGARHATAILEPEADSLVVAVWSATARSVAIEIRTADTIVTTAAAELDDAQRAAIEVGELAPGTAYQVTIMTDTGARIVHHARTAPAPDDPRPIRFAISADIDPSPEFESDIMEQVAAASPDLYISLGDFPYTDNGPPADTVEEYRARHAAARTSPHVRAMLRAVGVRAIYDDHEFRNDWDEARRTAEASRYAAAMQAWDEFFPLRGAPDVKYRSWRWGKGVECFLLDCRRYRSANAAPDDANKTMLGQVQRAWLVDAIRRSTATFKLVFTSVPLDFGNTGLDHWIGYLTERALLYDALTGVPGVLVVSADQHWFAAHRHDRGIREFQVGPLARGIGMPGAAPPGVLFRGERYNFGLVDIDGDQLTFSGVGVGGEVFYKETLGASDLTPGP